MLREISQSQEDTKTLGSTSMRCLELSESWRQKVGRWFPGGGRGGGDLLLHGLRKMKSVLEIGRTSVNISHITELYT